MPALAVIGKVTSKSNDWGGYWAERDYLSSVWLARSMIYMINLKPVASTKHIIMDIVRNCFEGIAIPDYCEKGLLSEQYAQYRKNYLLYFKYSITERVV